MRRRRLSCLVVGLIAASAPWSGRPARAGTALGTAFTYQGRLRKDSAPVDGTCDLQFSLWSTESGAGQVGLVQNVPGHPVTQGLFTVELDFGPGAFDGSARWLQIAVRSPAGAAGGYTTLSPRQPLTATPYALCALQALEAPWSGLLGIPADLLDGDADTTYDAGDGLSLTGNLFSVDFAGTGAATTAARSDHDHLGQSWQGHAPRGLEVTNLTFDSIGLAGIAPNGAGYGVYGEAGSITGAGVYGKGPYRGVVGEATSASGTTYGVYGKGEALGGGGVYGLATSATGNTSGVHGENPGSSGRGVFGEATHTGNVANYGGYFQAAGQRARAVFGNATDAGDVENYGGYFQAAGLQARALYAEAPADSGETYGLYAVSRSPDGTGVYGFVSSDGGENSGVVGQTRSPDGTGVFGHATRATGASYGVQGQSSSDAGTGVYGLVDRGFGATYGVVGDSRSPDGTGVYGIHMASSGTAAGVAGRSHSTSGRGVYGYAHATTGITHGVVGEARSIQGRGVYGMATDTGDVTNFGGYFEAAGQKGRAVFAKALSATGATYGVRAEVESPDGTALYGVALADTGETFGVMGRTYSPDGASVYGEARALSGFAYGVHGVSFSDQGRGVFGHADALTGNVSGVYGSTRSDSGTGVYGLALSNDGSTNGVYGESRSDTGVGVAGRAPTTGVSGLADADTGFTNGVSGWADSTGGVGVYGRAAADTGTTYGIYGRADSASGTAIYGTAPYTGVQGASTAGGGTTYGVRGTCSSTSGRGVQGEAPRYAVYGNGTGATGLSYGLYARCESTSGRGVYAFAAAQSGTTYGIKTQVNSPTGWGGYFEGGKGLYADRIAVNTTSPAADIELDVAGNIQATTASGDAVAGQSSSTSGRGVYGAATASTGSAYGVHGETSSTSGRGVYGAATASSGFTYGVYGESSSTYGKGVYGHASATTGATFAVHGWSESTSGRGVHGAATASSGTTYGVRGSVNSPDGWAGYFSGGKGLYGTGLAVGTTSPDCPAHTRLSVATSGGVGIDDHVACIENSGTTGNRQVLALKMNVNNPDVNNNFITFFDSDEAVGAIEGNAAGGVTLDSTAGDFAEYLPKQHIEEELSPGDIVGLRGGTLSKTTRGAKRAMVVSTAPAVRGNRPKQGSEPNYAAVAFIGQVPVKVRGAVRAGDYIVPSGLEDGTGVGVAPADLTAQQAAQVVGRALDATGGDRVTRVRVLVGLPPTEMWQRLLERRDARLAALHERLEALEALASGPRAAAADARTSLPTWMLLAGALVLCVCLVGPAARRGKRRARPVTGTGGKRRGHRDRPDHAEPPQGLSAKGQGN